MSSDFRSEDLPTSESLIRRIQEASDDFDSIQIMVANHMPIVGPNGETKLVNNCCCMIKLCNGESIIIRREDFQDVLNDGILTRMKIPIELVPLHKES